MGLHGRSSFAVPHAALAVFVVIAIAPGVLAAILPARRTSRLNVLEALQCERLDRWFNPRAFMARG